MCKFGKMGAAVLLMAGLSMGLTGCDSSDVNVNFQLPPAVAVAPNTLTGSVTDANGAVIAGATVKLGQTSATTDAQGMFLFNDVKAGTYNLVAEAAGKVKKEDVLVVENLGKCQNLVWNAVLKNEVKAEATASTTQVVTADVTTEAIKNNQKAEVKVEATVPAAATEEGVKISLTPLYDAQDAVTRAASSTMLIGSQLSASKAGAVLNKAIELSYEVDAEVAGAVQPKMLVNGAWVNAEHRVDAGKLVILAKEFTAYGLFIDVNFKEAKATEKVTFVQDAWDNLKGNKEIFVEKADYTYKVGTSIASQGTTVLTALLIEQVAARYGFQVKEVKGSYPMNVTIPFGAAVYIWGNQNKVAVTASANGKSVSATTYGDVTFTLTSSNRDHSGGTN